tara:strand:- start:228 stop:614 length:387 start_codon:yes stop_codon:yes gene_type:complete
MATKTKRAISSGELKRKYDTWMRNFKYGIEQLVNEDTLTQHYIFFTLLQECLYNETTIPYIQQMYHRDIDFYKVDDTDDLEDYQLIPLQRKKLLEAFEEVITGGGRKKFTNVISKIKQSLIEKETGDY